MEQFRLKTTIQSYASCSEFCEAYLVDKGDLILSFSHIIDHYLVGKTGNAAIIDMGKYGYGEPNDGMVEGIYQDIKDISYNRVIAIGGGSILDVAKLLILKYISPVQELFERKIPIEKEKQLILIPTTCGTGSEVTNISILELLQKKTKLGLATDELFADYAVLIPELLETLPFGAFGASSIDAFIHGIESYLSPKANSFTEMYSLQAMELIIKGYQAIATKGKECRQEYMKDFLIASTYAGIAFGNAGCAAVHALSYPLGSVFHIAHGESNYALFLGVFTHYMKLKPMGKITKLNTFLAATLSCKEEEVYTKLELLFNTILQRKPLKEYGVSEPQLEEFTNSVLANQGRLMANNYVELKREDVLAIYQSVYSNS